MEPTFTAALIGWIDRNNVPLPSPTQPLTFPSPLSSLILLKKSKANSSAIKYKNTLRIVYNIQTYTNDEYHEGYSVGMKI